MNGRLGTADLTANVDVVVYTVPVGFVATVTIAILARTTTGGVYCAVTQSAEVTNQDYLEYNALVPVSGVLERTGVVLSAGEHIIVRSSVGGVSVRVHGFEESV